MPDSLPVTKLPALLKVKSSEIKWDGDKPAAYIDAVEKFPRGDGAVLVVTLDCEYVFSEASNELVRLFPVEESNGKPGRRNSKGKTKRVTIRLGFTEIDYLRRMSHATNESINSIASAAIDLLYNKMGRP